MFNELLCDYHGGPLHIQINQVTSSGQPGAEEFGGEITTATWDGNRAGWFYPFSIFVTISKKKWSN
jgi:hypothetical protein